MSDYSSTRGDHGRFGAVGAAEELSAGGQRTSPGHIPAFVALGTRQLTLVLFVAAAVLSVVGAFANIVIYQIADSPQADIARFMNRFDLGHEPSLPAWFSSIVLFLNSAMLMLIARAKHLNSGTFVAHWLVLGILFLGMSIDESVMFHEMLDRPINLAVATSGFLLFPWAVLGAAFSLAVFIGYLKFLLHLPRHFAFLFVASGALYVGGAVGLEFVAGSVIDRHGVASIHHTIVQTFEETLEMAGAILFFFSLTEYWNSAYRGVGICLSRQARP